MAPFFAWGHACEFLVARLETDGARIRLEITADYGANPLIADEAEARDAVRSILQALPRNGKLQALEDLAPVKLEHRSTWDPDAPASLASAADGQAHQLLTGIWEWQCPFPALRLVVPKGHPHDVLLWRKTHEEAAKEPQWMLLIAGESSAEILLKPSPPGPAGIGAYPWAWWPLLGAAGILMTVGTLLLGHHFRGETSARL